MRSRTPLTWTGTGTRTARSCSGAGLLPRMERCSCRPRRSARRHSGARIGRGGRFRGTASDECRGPRGSGGCRPVVGGGRSRGWRALPGVVHVDAAALSEPAEGGCEVAEGPALAAETARRLTCDSSLARVSSRTTRRSRSAGRRGRCRRPCGERCAAAIAAVASPAVNERASSMPITSATGQTAARRASTTSSCSAGATTA